MRWIRSLHRVLVAQRMPGWAVDYYDHLIEAVAEAYFGPFEEQILRDFPDGAAVVDAGTGAGHLPIRLAMKAPGFHLTGIDLSAKCLRVARAKAQAAGVTERVRFVQANLEATGLPGACADRVISTCALHHWRRPARVLGELARLLKPGGELWIWDDAAEVGEDARHNWVAQVERLANAGKLFQRVFRFESRYLAYTESEIQVLARRSNLELTGFRIHGVFLHARLRPRSKK